MAFHVNWVASVIDQVREIWMAVEDRNAVAAAHDWIDTAQLRSDPLCFGEERTGALRIGFAPPLAVMFSLFPEDLRVDVVGIKRISGSDS